MKERGMIFNGEMVRAILDGRKTQTRRPANPSTANLLDLQEQYPHKKYNISCPFGVVGDRIWVRETWARYNIDQDSHDMAYRATPPSDWPEEGRWRPSIHMPRWASRLMLEITGVRVERLNGISETDAEAEGIDMEALFDAQDCYDCIADHNMTGRPTAIGAFKYLWESIYGEENWQSNPWVWVIEFKVVPNVQDNPA